jgi:glutamate-ammonia-ligase adenylyltransferase
MASVIPLDPHLQVLGAALRERLGNHALLERTLNLVESKAPDEQLALSALIQLSEQSRPALLALLQDGDAAGDLIFCLGGSQTIGDYLCTSANGLEAVAQVRTAGVDALAAAIKLDLPGPLPRQEGARMLGRFKRDHFVRIAIADLLGRTTVGETMMLMSQLADECIAGALAIGRQLMGERIAGLAGFCVIALGKLGVRELNLSSDIDLCYIFDAAQPAREQEAATHLAELVTELLADCFRVDLRLRPGGSHAPLVSSIENAINFYQNFGQTWERAALLRGRAAAGEIALGQRLLAELAPFIYRRYLDFETLGQLRTMKQMIEREFRSPSTVRSNIKLGWGGIRELEFIVQALTLVYAGRDPRLRYPRTVDALERLREFGYLSASRARQLSSAYLFLRDVEHKLQVVADLQTHSLPANAAGMGRLAARMSFGKGNESTQRFAAVLEQHRNLVSEVFREMLPAADHVVEASATAQQAFEAALDPERAAPFLRLLGFAEPVESAGHLLLLARGPAHGLASPRRRELLKTLGPLLLDEISQQANPDHALANLAACIAAIGARTSFLTLLEQHPATRRVLLGLFASSQYLSGLFIRHPDMLDVLVRSDQARLRRSALEIRVELRELLAHATDFEDRLDAMRALRHQEFLRVAIADVAGQMELSDVETELTALAESVLATALDLARQEVAGRFPQAVALPLCALAMGRLGSGEMSYNSDLDLIFVYGGGEEDGDVARHEIAARIVQKFVAILEVRTREGYLYKCDLRLRPSGNAGPLVTSLAGFRQYHRDSSATWERQALIRGRVVAGDSRLGEAVEQARLEFVYGRGLRRDEVAEIAAMRQRIEQELGQETPALLNIKQGRGGLIDAEFLTQMLALRHGHDYPQLRQRRVRDLLDALKAGAFMASSDAEAMGEDYQFLERLENYLRMDTDQAAWAVSTDPVRLRPLARRLGFDTHDGPARLLAELQRRRSRIRQIYHRCFAAEEGAH